MEQLKFRKLRADEIECRVGTVNQRGCSLLLYKDARVDQNLLDETVGPYNWQRHHELINGNLFCSVGIYVKRTPGESREWVWKQDVGTESNTEKEKGEASDSFKRACFNWGIGRELYTAPFIWIGAADAHVENKNGKYTTYERFRVKQIDYEGNRICALTILNKDGRVVFRMGEKARQEEPNNEKPQEEAAKPQEEPMVGPVSMQYIFLHSKETITQEAANALSEAARGAGVDPQNIPKAYKKMDILELTYAQYYTLMGGKHWNAFKG